MLQILIDRYKNEIIKTFDSFPTDSFAVLLEALETASSKKSSVYLCGNGGSAANAEHIANEFMFVIGKKSVNAEALSANSSLLTCLGNDLNYDSIYSEQIKIKGKAGDILIALSTSGNSPNIVKAIETANQLDMKTFAIVAYDGGLCKKLSRHNIHFEVNDTQIAEDFQLVLGHLCLKVLWQS